MTYQEYTTFCIGEPIAEKIFGRVLPFAQSKLKKYAPNANFENEETKRVLTFVINKIDLDGKSSELDTYSNGVESFSFKDDSDKFIYDIVRENLTSEELYRGI